MKARVCKFIATQNTTLLSIKNSFVKTAETTAAKDIKAVIGFLQNFDKEYVASYKSLIAPIQSIPFPEPPIVLPILSDPILILGDALIVGIKTSVQQCTTDNQGFYTQAVVIMIMSAFWRIYT